MATKEIVYQVVGKEDIQSAMFSSESSDRLRRDSAREDSVVWGQTVLCIMSRLPGGIKRDTTKEGIQGNGELLKDVMAKYILSKVTIPEKGLNRSGESFDVSDKDGKVKWSSWASTRRIWAYLGDIARVLSFGKESELMPEPGKICPRIDILAACKNPESPMAGVERLTKQLAERLQSITNPVDRLNSHKLINSLAVPGVDPVDECSQLINKLDAQMTGMDREQKDHVRSLLSRLTKHFVPPASTPAESGMSATH